MNYENLKKVLDSNMAILAPMEDGRKLATNGHVLCLVPSDFTVKETHYYKPESEWGAVRAGMVSMWASMFGGNEWSPLTSGDVHEYQFMGFIRRMAGQDGIEAVVNERYHRVFDPDAQWSGTAKDKPLRIKEAGVVVGILMPMRIDKPSGAVIAPPSDEDLYAAPEDDDEDDDDEIECPHCGGEGYIKA